jgi:hypothetical protein
MSTAKRRAATRTNVVCLDKYARQTNPGRVKTRPNNLQLKLPEFLLDIPVNWAKQNNWLTNARKEGQLHDGPRPHVSFSISCGIAGLSRLSHSERQKILLDGAKFILAEQERRGTNGKQRIRLCREDGIRPAGAAKSA